MSFLQPFLLWALPLASLPIVIHLINQRRYQTTRWGAMMFLLAANRMSRGYAKLRQYLILAARVLACAGLIFVISRPLTGGWLAAAAGGRPDTTILLIDRSPSMQQRGLGAEGSKLETGRRRLARTLKTVGSARWVLVDGANGKPVELESVDELTTAPAADPTSAPADLPALLGVARDYIQANKSGRTEVWICSDARENDWNADGGRWQALREAFGQSPQGVRFHLLAYPQPASGNLSVRVTEARFRDSADGPEVLVTLRLTREGGGEARQAVPVRFEIDGARSAATVEMAGPQAELKDHRIVLGRGRERGYGKVSIPADTNPADDDFWFVFDRPAPRKAVVVAEDPQAARPLQLAASIPPDPSVKCSAEVIGVEGLPSVDWAETALLLWQAPLPEGDAAARVKAFVDRGGQALFFPPRVPGGGGTFLGARWGDWAEGPGENAVVGWRGDGDLLAATMGGTALPVGTLGVRKACRLGGDVTTLATLKGGAPLLARAATDAGGAYFCATTPAVGDSSLASGGVVLYVLVQRAMAAGASVLGGTRQLAAGAKPVDDPTRWKRLSGADEAVSTDFALHRGAYRSGERLLAVNRPAAEDAAPILAEDRLAGLFRGLDFSRVDDRAGGEGSLIQEIWRLFLAAMLAAMVVEAALCLPRKSARSADDRAWPARGAATATEAGRQPAGATS